MAIDFDNLEKQIRERGKTQILDNGITLISENVPGSGLVTGDIRIYAGAAYEKPGDEGTMHFLEHMSFGDSKLYSDPQNRNLEAGLMGLHLNARTGNFTVTYDIRGGNESGYLLQKNFLKSFLIVSDVAFSPNLTEYSRQKELSVIHRELAESDERKALNRLTALHKAIDAKLESNNPVLRRAILGKHESIDAITRDKLVDYHSKFFVGNNVLVRIVGDLNGDGEILDTVKSLLWNVPAGEKTNPIELVAEKPFEKNETLELKLPTPGDTHVEIYFQTPPTNSLEDYKMNLLAQAFGSSSTGLLFNELREKNGLVYSIKSRFVGHEKTGLLQLSYLVSPNRLPESLDIIDHTIQKIKKGEFSPQLVDVAIAQYVPQMLSTIQNPGWINNELVSRYEKSRIGYDSTPLERLKVGLALNKQDVINAANQYLGENRLIVLMK